MPAVAMKPDAMSPQNGQQPAQRNFRRKPSGRALNLLLLLPYLGLLWPPLYARAEPYLFGFPFFYWYQFLWVIISALLTGFVYLATHRR